MGQVANTFRGGLLTTGYDSVWVLYVAPRKYVCIQVEPGKPGAASNSHD